MKLVRACLCLAWLCVPAFAAAQPYPNKPVRIVVPITPGSATDIVVRAVGEQLQARLGAPVVVENRPGAGTTIGSAVVAKSAPDGYTLLANSSAHTANLWMYPSLPYDSAKDFAPVAPLASLPNVLIVAPGSPWKSVADLVADAKAAPGKLNYASAGIGSGTHMNAEKFRLAAGFQAEHIAFKGTPEAITETMTGRVQWFFAPLVAAISPLRDGRLRALAVGSRQRSSLLPEVPTTEEAGAPDSAFNFWLGLWAPAKTPAEIVDKLNGAVQESLKSPEVRERLAKLGGDPLLMTPRQFETFLEGEFKSNEILVKNAGIKLTN